MLFLQQCGICCVDFAHDLDIGSNRSIFHSLSQPGARACDNENALVKTGADCVNSDYIAGRITAVNIDGSNNQQFLSQQSFVLLSRDTVPRMRAMIMAYERKPTG